MYQVVIDSDVQEQIAALPTEALPFFAETLGVLELTPWNGHPFNKRYTDGEVRELLFGPHGAGKVTYLILDDQQRVDLLMVQWVG